MPEENAFDLVRLTKAKKAVDLSYNTITAYAKKGWIKLYRTGDRAVWFSRSELAAAIKLMGSKEAK